MRVSQRLEPPITAERLAQDLRALGVQPGEVLLVHTSLRSLSGPRSMVVGGAIAVVDALTEAVHPGGTVAMTTFSSSLTDPSLWTKPPPPDTWWHTIRQHLPAWRPAETPSGGVGVVPEVFRSMHGVSRSDHPHASFAARGPRAPAILHPHPLDDALGEQGPLARLAAMGARVLMLGCPWTSCTGFHLGEMRTQPPPRLQKQGAPLIRGGARVWVEWTERTPSTEAFDELGPAFDRTGSVLHGTVGRAPSRLFDLRAAAEFAAHFLRGRRGD